MNGWELGAVIAVAVYNLAVIAGTCYLIAVHGWSPWWLLGAIGLCKSIRTGKAAEED